MYVFGEMRQDVYMWVSGFKTVKGIFLGVSIITPVMALEMALFSKKALHNIEKDS